MKALLITRDNVLHAEIASQGAARVPPLNLAATRSGIRDALDRAAPDTPALVIIDASDFEPSEADQLERLAKHYPDASFMLLTREHQQDLLIRAMRAGVREVLQLPLIHRAFHEAMDRIAASAGETSVRDGKVLAFISCKGGSGATFISTNFAYALATLADKKVLLIDLDSQSHCAVGLGVPPVRGAASAQSFLAGQNSLRDALRPPGGGRRPGQSQRQRLGSRADRWQQRRAAPLSVGRLCPIARREYCARLEGGYVPGASARRLFSINRPQQFAETVTENRRRERSIGGWANGEES